MKKNRLDELVKVCMECFGLRGLLRIVIRLRVVEFVGISHLSSNTKDTCSLVEAS